MTQVPTNILPITISPSYGHSTVGSPRALVDIAGQLYVPISFQISTCNFSASDTATVTLALQGEYQTTTQGGYSLAATDFGEATQNGQAYPISIYAGFPRDPNPGGYGPRDLVLQFTGIVDKFDWASYLKGEVEITCRSFAALFLNTKTTAAWNNMTTVAVAAQLAKNHGIDPSGISVKNPNTMQTVFNRDFVSGTQNMDEWSLLQAMAEVDDADCFVRGTTLYYRDRLKSGSGPKVTLDWERNLIDCGVDHSPQFSELVKVDVKAYSPLTRTTVRSTVQGVVGQQPTPGSQRTSVSTAVYDPNFGLRIKSSTFNRTNTVNGVSPIPGLPGSGTTTVSSGSSVTIKRGGTYSSGWTSMPKGPSALEYVYHANFTDDPPGMPGGLSAQAKADNAARNIWMKISSHLFHMTAHASVTPEVQALLNQDTLWHLNGPVPSHNLDYYGKRVDQSWEVSQDEDGHSGGWTFTVDGVNVPIMEQTL